MSSGTLTYSNASPNYNTASNTRSNVNPNFYTITSATASGLANTISIEDRVARRRPRVGSDSERIRGVSEGRGVKEVISFSSVVGTSGVVVGTGGGVVVVVDSDGENGSEEAEEESERRMKSKPSRIRSEARPQPRSPNTLTSGGMRESRKKIAIRAASSTPHSPSRSPIVVCESACELFFRDRQPNHFVMKESKKMLALGSLEDWVEYTVILEEDGMLHFSFELRSSSGHS